MLYFMHGSTFAFGIADLRHPCILDALRSKSLQCVCFDIVDLRHPYVKDALEANRYNISCCWLAHPCSMDAVQASAFWSQKCVFAGLLARC